jgi:hypothetical protein
VDFVLASVYVLYYVYGFMYVEPSLHPKNSTKKLPEIINSFGKVEGYKMNTQKSIAFLYTNNTKTQKEIR